MLGDLTYAQAIALVTLPVCFTKNVINMVQLWKASKILVGVDLAERAKKREEKLAKKTIFRSSIPIFNYCLLDYHMLRRTLETL